MKQHFTILALLLLSTGGILLQCSQPKCKPGTGFSGKIMDIKGPLAGATISLGGSDAEVKSAADGSFCIVAGRDRKGDFVLNVTLLGYGLVSKVYAGPTSDITITMTPATVQEDLDPAEPIVLTDTTPATSEPATPDPATPIFSPRDTIPFIYNGAGQLVGFGAPQEVIDTYQAVEDFEPQNTGATVEVEADGLEEIKDREDGAQGAFFQESTKENRVTGSISTIDIYAPDGMPGNYTTRMGDGNRGFMITYGAVDVNFFRNGNPMKLKAGKKARLTIPVDTLALIYGQDLPDSIPLLVYDKNTGLWARDENNHGRLNKDRTAYVATVTHFSVFNMDEEFAVNSATCYKICSNGTPPAGAYPAGARIQITGDIPGHVKDLPFGTTLCAGDGGCTGGFAYAINNMKANTPIGVRLFDGNTNRIISSYVFITGAATATSNVGFTCASPPNNLPNYGDCGGPVTVDWAAPPPYMDVDGTMLKPVIAIDRDAATGGIKVSWLFIDGPPPTYINPNIDYHVEWSTTTDNFGTANGDGTIALNFDLLASPSLLNSTVIANNATNFPGAPTETFIFRIRVGGLPINASTIYSDPSGSINP